MEQGCSLGIDMLQLAEIRKGVGIWRYTIWESEAGLLKRKK
jgi:hypothetical protein